MTCVGLALAFGFKSLLLAVWLQGRASFLPQPVTATITDEALRTETPGMSAEYHWSGVAAVEDVADVWLVRFDKVRVLPLPKTVFSDPDRQTFAQFVGSSGLAGASPSGLRKSTVDA